MDDRPAPSTCETPEPADTNSHVDVYRWNEEAGAEGESTCLTCDAGSPTPATSPSARCLRRLLPRLLRPSTPAAIPPPATPDGNGADRRRSASSPLGRGEAVLQASVAPSKLSADGNVLLFAARASRALTADRIAAAARPTRWTKERPGTCQELYRYDDRGRSLECLSCLRGGFTTRAAEPPAAVACGDGFALSRDGSTVAFTDREALLPRDVNNGPDVYEWRNGSVRLITDGVTHFPGGTRRRSSAAVDATAPTSSSRSHDPGLTGFEHDGLTTSTTPASAAASSRRHRPNIARKNPARARCWALRCLRSPAASRSSGRATSWSSPRSSPSPRR